jgi:ComF family protein
MRSRSGRFPLSSLFAAGRDLLFPARCLACGVELGRHVLPLLCPSCRKRLVPLYSPLCRCCGTPFTTGRDHLCGICLRKPPPFALARSAFLYQDPLDQLIIDIKFGHHLTGLATLAHLAWHSPALATLGRPDLVLPVPLHRDRLRERGFNQALLLARSCFAGRAEVAVDVLRKDLATLPQTRLSGRARRKNLRSAFAVHRPDLVAGKKILVVDDVFTTGSTMAACARALVRAGAARVEGFTLARSL